MKQKNETSGRLPDSADPRTLLRHTIARRLVSAVFQPIVDLREGEVAGFEALSRPTPESGFPDAGSLFDAAERLGTLWELEEVTRSCALNAAADWSGGDLLFLNCSPQVFADPRFASSLAGSVAGAPGLDPSRVVLEITERSDQQYVEGLAEQVRLLRSRRFPIAIDDVGAGTSGLNRIMSLRPHWLKLDRELVGSIERDRARQNLIRFFVHFARLSGTKVIAEGIEREEELATLIDLGVVFGQGFYLGRPGSRDRSVPSEKAARMRERRPTIDIERPTHSAANRIGRFARPILSASGASPSSETARSLLREPGTPGAAITDGRRHVGWCDRETILAWARADGATPVDRLPRRGLTIVAPDATVAEALDLIASRDDLTLADPLLVGRGGQITGVLLIRDLLAAAADLGRNFRTWTAPLTGLPGRVRADQHINRSIVAGNAGAARDAAFVDIRCLADYNVAYGYDLGDRLIQDLAAMLETTVVRGEESVFLAHLGDDRFLVTAPSGVIAARVHALAAQFRRTLHTYCGGLLIGGGSGWDNSRPHTPPSVDLPGAEPTRKFALRVLLLRRAFAGVSDARELYRLEHGLRNAVGGRGIEIRSIEGSSLVIADAEKLHSIERNPAPSPAARDAA